MKRILIADPDPAFRKALALLIARRLAIQNIDEAADTGTLIQKLADTRPDLLLLIGRSRCPGTRNLHPAQEHLPRLEGDPAQSESRG